MVTPLAKIRPLEQLHLAKRQPFVMTMKVLNVGAAVDYPLQVYAFVETA